MTSRAIAAIIGSLSMLIHIALPASAGSEQWAGSGDGSIWAGVQTGTPDSAGTWNGVACSWTVETAYDSGIGSGSNAPISMEIDGIEYVLYTRTCGTSWSSVWVPQISEAQLGQQASALVRASIPAPRLQMAPNANSAVVLVSTWFWADSTWWRPVSATAWIPTPDGVIWATAVATPSTITFATEDSVVDSAITESVTCIGPGPDWNLGWGDDLDSPCSYEYEHASTAHPSGRFDARVSVAWTIEWTSSSGAGGSLPGWTSSSSLLVRVQELHALVR
ncbi:MAG: hypothetical protein B7C54_00555 [Acidimicrobiales bacterium mtb01]|nr:hypothetical protein [Actinomycetota bacterium]TEX48276.1 MAG: hypothetical protein B7C54_00555 [Acidimicrobiales bacterium mtb01]